ncbi:MAG: long-chain-fatty-acyl-CoA reductase [Pseudomonadales bacterium 32-61-5]|nr:MAG: long-chain-fatty-acyl-CoA reductase [Pseudomonadales bacterium 32-61-5]
MNVIEPVAGPAAETQTPIASLIVRGRIITDHLVEMGGRGGDLTFLAPDVKRYIEQIPLADPAALADLYDLSFEQILDYLEELGRHLDVATNPHLQRARALSYLTAPMTPPLVDASYAGLGAMFDRAFIREMADRQIGIDYLEGWVSEEQSGGLRLEKRCFGARALHIIAGNSPMVAALTIIRNAILRSDAIIKTPSNDPFTALAIAETMIDFALQPGLELISLDPKRSESIVGPEAFDSDEAMNEAAIRLASDIGAMNQVGCVNARVVYALSGTDDRGIGALERFGAKVYDAMLRLPERTSTTPKSYDRDLKASVDALRFQDDWYTVIGGQAGEGAIIISRLSDAVDFATKLGDRTANLVPVDSLDDVVGAVDAYTQTVGVFPESLKAQLLNVLPLYGAQRFVSLGFAVQASLASPQDGIEPMRRMGKWIVNEIRTVENSRAPWLD